jgi:galactokinase
VTLAAEARERDAFLALARRLRWLEPGHPVSVARAPGRLDVMGGIADYSGSLVLELPLREAAFAAVQLQTDPVVRVLSVDPDAPTRVREVSVPTAELVGVDCAAARAAFRRRTGDEWAAYVAGVVVALTEEAGLSLAGGARILLASRVPEGKGVSSSAAIEVATLYALAAAAGLELDAVEVARLCQRTENLVVGAPCGIMDQMTSACGVRGALLELLCQPAIIQGTLPVPPDLAFFGIDSGVRHAVSGSDYTGVRVGAFMGRRILGVRGYLAQLPPSELDPGCLPETMTGADFLARFGTTDDPVTTVEPTRDYPVRASTLHPVHEHHRVRLFAELLRAPGSERSRELLGELMYESHASYSACGLGCDATDALVHAVRAAGPAAGLYGAKITGGGSGGTVAILARAEAEPAVRDLARRHGSTRVFAGSSAGAAAFGTLTYGMKP